MKTQNFKIAFVVLFFFRLFVVSSELITLVGDQNAGNTGESNEDVENEIKLIDMPTLISEGTYSRKNKETQVDIDFKIYIELIYNLKTIFSETYHKATIPGKIATHIYKYQIINKSGRFYRVRINTIRDKRDWANLINNSKIEVNVEMTIIVVGCVTADLEFENQTRRVDLWGCSMPKWIEVSLILHPKHLEYA
ncbi:hypothetical protein BB560_004553 [Smittium megazygosporum]|uniref:Uncharacterized protein n=1 Tax=Smittium megazygosporum TaxID=133381 RepID=A0A2T9Z928_9FUNG|nr:hypothetical protein BB560_004553 [Smittium megazygosporum]